MTESLDATLSPTEFLDHRSPVVREFVDRALAGTGAATDTDRAVALYYAVRDGIRYEVYDADLSRRGLTASRVIERGAGFCVHKSIVYAAALRAVGVPSRIVYADVRNHLASPRLRELVGGDVFRFHSLTSVHLGGTWLKATPVFNKLLCRLYGIKPLDFDGRTDSLYHPYDEQGRRHMEFLTLRGEFDDVPYSLVTDGIRQAHPLLFASTDRTAAGSLVTEAITVEGS
ncbi:transglutaminase-like superfamily protein [Streptomyces variegatus]|jgi:transglutaminase-like putative cysteine protease|uniref:Transglutaminase-like superfamily protein n=1 Tax=Streptomyces variegatus TaxID=284040 RepID=A0A0M2GRF3_9ACTN|nr:MULTISPECIES: transglutaminase domain-containing protein [Streptomyces]KJK38651.1 transglutaminase-like superfamily protein [Streptomyces variegatus]